MAQQFYNITNNSIQNGLQHNLKDAIEDVGGSVPSTACLWQYPEIIRKNLVARTLSNINILGKDIISVNETFNDDTTFYNISTIYDTNNISRPNYSLNNADWGSALSVDKIFNDLFDNILPAVKGVHAGDITVTDVNGNDTKEWTNTLFNISGNKSGLQASAKYLRLYLTCQPEPIYISIDSSISDLTKGYNVINSDTVEFILSDSDMTMSAHIACITNNQLNEII